MPRYQHVVEIPTPAELEAERVVAVDALLRQDSSVTRAYFQGRFIRKTSFGDFKNRPGHKPEQTEALVENLDRSERAAELTNAATDAGVILESTVGYAEQHSLDLATGVDLAYNGADRSVILEGSTEALDGLK